MLDELRNEDVRVAAAHAIDRVGERIVVAEWHLLAEVLVARDRPEAPRATKLGPRRVRHERPKLGGLRLLDVLERPIPRGDAPARGRKENGTREAGKQRPAKTTWSASVTVG